MPGLITATGTWTTLQTDLAPYRIGAQTSTANANSSNNVPTNLSLNRADLATVPEEVFRFIDLIAENYGSAPLAASNNRLLFWPAAVLLRTWITALFDGQTATNPAGNAGVLRSTGLGG